MNIDWALAAAEDLSDGIDYYDRQQECLGERFYQAVLSTIDKIVRHPRAWFPLGGESRRCLVSGFPYGVYYRTGPGLITVLAVLDLRRSPEAWQERLRELGI